MLAGAAIVGLWIATGCAGSHPLAGEHGDTVVMNYVSEGDSAVPELVELLEHEDPSVQYRARTALGHITGQWGARGDGIRWQRSLADVLEDPNHDPDRPILVLELFGRFDEEFC